MVHGFYQRDHSYLYRGQNNKTNRTDPTHWDNEESNNNGSRTAGQGPNPNPAPSVNNEPYTPSADMVALQNQIIHGLQQDVTTPEPETRSAQGETTSASDYTYEEVEIDGSSYYKVTDKDGNESYISPYVYHNKIENNPNGDIAGIIKDYGKSNPNEEKNYSINSDGNYVYTTEDSDTKYQEQVKDKDGNLLYTTTDVYNPKDGKTTSTTENADGSKTVTVTDEDDYVVSKTTYDKDGNVVDSYTAPSEDEEDTQTESAYAKAKREAQEKADRESNKPLDEPKTDLSQDIPDDAKSLPTNNNENNEKPEQEQPLDEPPTTLAPEMPDAATALPENPIPSPPRPEQEQPLIEPPASVAPDMPGTATTLPENPTPPPSNTGNNTSNNNTNSEEDDPIIDGGVLPEVTVTPETNPGTPPPLKEPPASVAPPMPGEATTLPSGTGQSWAQGAAAYYTSHYGDGNGGIDTDALTNAWVSNGGTATTWTNNGDGTWSQSDWSPAGNTGEDWSWTGFDVFSVGGGGGGGGFSGVTDDYIAEQERLARERAKQNARVMMQVDDRL